MCIRDRDTSNAGLNSVHEPQRLEEPVKPYDLCVLCHQVCTKQISIMYFFVYFSPYTKYEGIFIVKICFSL